MGMFILQYVPNNMPEKINGLRGHMVGGIMILVLTLIRFGVRLKTKHPEPIKTNGKLLNAAATFVHYGLYFAVIMMSISGLVLAGQSNLFAAVFAKSATLPTDFSAFGARAAHGWIAIGLLVLIACHVAAALYHQFVQRDSLFGRMWFGRR
jgi:cytochrome b561